MKIIPDSLLATHSKTNQSSVLSSAMRLANCGQSLVSAGGAGYLGRATKKKCNTHRVI